MECTVALADSSEFQSTPPREGVTLPNRLDAERLQFQSTPPREGVTVSPIQPIRGPQSFNPHPPVRG